MTLSAEIVTLLEGLKARGATNTELAMACWLVPTIEIERTMLVLQRQLRNVNTARGFVLDLIGKLVGRKREGVTDDEVYRRYVRAQLTANESDGSIEDVLRVASLVVYDDDATYVIDNAGAAAYVLIVDGVEIDEAVAQAVVRMVLKATAAGARATIAWTDTPVADALRWDTGDWDDDTWWHTADRSF